MKAASPQQVKAALERPDPALRLILLHGNDDGLIHERAQAFARCHADDLSDPFQVVSLTMADLRDNVALLQDEVASLPMMGGRRVVLLDGRPTAQKDTEKLGKAIKLLLAAEAGDGIAIVEAGTDLDNRASAVQQAMRSKKALAVGCYEDSDRDLESLIREVLGAADLVPDRDAIAWLVDHLGANRMISRSELEKLVLYKLKDPDRTVTRADAASVVGNSSAGGLGDIAAAVSGGRLVELEDRLDRAWLAGEAPAMVVRLVQKRFMALHLAQGYVAGGVPPKQAAKQVGVFWKQEAAFISDMNHWPGRTLEKALLRLFQADVDSKTTDYPAETVVNRHLLAIAYGGRRR
ncbi:DNA polymerase III subunit delta [Yunchengibacter salinarum]|uniref:DNA polymerase III subunit delta n=1 Tax=Yunchengibacter salinarum TaxID=3133399 RepID=UPI0035B5A98C